MNDNHQHYACLYARELPIQALLLEKPELRKKPVVVMEGEPPTQVVCSMNTRAQLLGVTPGMTIVEVETFPEAEVLPRSLHTETLVRSKLLKVAGSYSPRIEERSIATAFLCAIDIAGSEALFGKPETLAKNLVRRVRSAGVSACVTVSRNFYAAFCLAKSMPRNIEWRVIRDGAEANELFRLPIDVMDLSMEQADLFALWGIQTLGMLAALPETELISRLGQEGGRLHRMARGELEHFFQPAELPFRLEERREFDAPIEDMESVLFCSALMLDELIARASSRILALASVSLHLYLNGGDSHTVVVRPAMPCNDKHLWLKLLRHKLESTPPAAGVLALNLHAEPGPTSKLQLGLFSPQLPEPGRLDVLLAR
ncbi:MAG TPA: DNA polymerase Y family protein, partial [Candidatus Angelobacter sp.]|nr:DNA polymerase Y family protein [Candidatus Angelobacter sp.]